MNKMTLLSLTVMTALSLLLVSTIQSKASGKSFTGVVPFVTSSDRLGFFDQSSGRIYMYDSNFSQCVFEGQVTTLGQQIQAITK